MSLLENEIEVKNAIIESVSITNADYGLTIWLILDYGGSGQGFGGYSLYSTKHNTHFNTQWNVCGHFIQRVMEIVGVEEWNEIPGKTIRVKANQHGVQAIGHIINDDWFDSKKEFALHVREE
jgi:hypothetical protein